VTGKDSLCIALDGSDRSWILSTARALRDDVGWLKVGLEAFIAHGPPLVEEVAVLGPKVFLDLKLHDIPATVHKAAANCTRCGAGMITVHAGGGRKMIEAAVDGVASARRVDPPLVVAVTVLTSLDSPALRETGIDRSPRDAVLARALLAQECSAAGVVASGQEAAELRRACGKDFLIVTPGIRPATSAADDQRRVLTPAQAIAGGADVLVVGRPVTRSEDPVAAARSIVKEINSVA
jgi:orotidine-5'-phosphate decarboxylase